MTGGPSNQEPTIKGIQNAVTRNQNNDATLISVKSAETVVFQDYFSSVIDALKNPTVKEAVSKYSYQLPDGSLEIPLLGRLYGVTEHDKFSFDCIRREWNGVNAWEDSCGELVSIMIPIDSDPYFKHTMQSGKFESLAARSSSNRYHNDWPLEQYRPLTIDKDFFDVRPRPSRTVGQYPTENGALVAQLGVESQECFERVCSAEDIGGALRLRENLKGAVEKIGKAILDSLEYHQKTTDEALSRSQKNIQSIYPEGQTTSPIPFISLGNVVDARAQLTATELQLEESLKSETEAYQTFLLKASQVLNDPAVRTELAPYCHQLPDGTLELPFSGTLYSTTNSEKLWNNGCARRVANKEGEWGWEKGEMLVIVMKPSEPAIFRHILQEGKHDSLSTMETIHVKDTPIWDINEYSTIPSEEVFNPQRIKPRCSFTFSKESDAFAWSTPGWNYITPYEDQVVVAKQVSIDELSRNPRYREKARALIEGLAQHIVAAHRTSTSKLDGIASKAQKNVIILLDEAQV